MSKKKKKFDEEEGSVANTLSNQTKAMKDKYRRNRSAYYQDYWNLEQWARDGYQSREEEHD